MSVFGSASYLLRSRSYACFCAVLPFYIAQNNTALRKLAEFCTVRRVSARIITESQHHYVEYAGEETVI